jgi:hypothetical protein
MFSLTASSMNPSGAMTGAFPVRTPFSSTICANTWEVIDVRVSKDDAGNRQVFNLAVD